MIAHRRPALLLVTLVVALAACGGGSGATSGSTASAPGGAQSQAAVGGPSQAAEAPPASQAPASAPVAPEPPPAGGGAGEVCALVTQDEHGGILGQPVRTSVIAGPPDTCDIQSADGAPLAAFVLTKIDGVSASFVFDAFAGSPTAEQIAGIGERAAYDPNQGALVVLKNGSVLSVAVFDDGSADAGVVVDLMKQIGSLAAGRM